MTSENILEEIAADARIDLYSYYEDENEVYLRIADPTVRCDVEASYRQNYNVDVSERGLNLCVSW